MGDTHVIDIDFTSEVLGEFSEQFTFTLRGSSETLSVHFKGHVVGPTFHFDAEELDFGRVSFEFLHSKNLCLYNTSEIPMEYVEVVGYWWCWWCWCLWSGVDGWWVAA